MGYGDYEEEQPDIQNSGYPQNYSQYHETLLQHNDSNPAGGQKNEEIQNHNTVYDRNEHLRKIQALQKNTSSNSISCNIDEQLVGGARSSFTSSTRSNSSSLGTNGTNNSLGSRGSVSDAHNIRDRRTSPNTSTFGDSLTRNIDSESETTIINEKTKHHTPSQGITGCKEGENYVLNGWNTEMNNRDNLGQGGSLSSFSSSNGSSKNRSSSHRSYTSSDRK